MPQMKVQDKTSEKPLNVVEIGNLPEKEFRTMIVNIIQDLGKRIEAKVEKMQGKEKSEPRSPTLQADTLPSEPPGKLKMQEMLQRPRKMRGQTNRDE